METDEKQAEEHMFKCSCGTEATGHCEHCDRPCKKKRCLRCRRQVKDKDLRNTGKDAA